jgi:hypothetical protein
MHASYGGHMGEGEVLKGEAALYGALRDNGLLEEAWGAMVEGEAVRRPTEGDAPPGPAAGRSRR